MSPEDLQSARGLYERLTPGRPQPALTGEIGRCPCPAEARAGMYLINGDWELAHRAAQESDAPLAAYWHALVHRHEPAYGNSKYWLRRVGTHPVHDALVEAARRAGRVELVAPGGNWDPARFTDHFANPAHSAWTADLDALEMDELLRFSLGV